jgi:hypothetical protein
VIGARRAIAFALAFAGVATAAGSSAASVAAEPGVPDSAPVDKRVYMVADSVGLGARDALPDAFPADWQVVLDGTPALFVEQLESKYVRAVPQSLLGDYGVIAGGYNYPYWDPARFDRSIDSIIQAFADRGVEHVFWVTLREVKPEYITAGAWNQVQPYYWYFPTVNEHLERAVERHPNLTLIDWAAAADRPGITYDAIHLNTTGAQLYSSLIRQAVDAATHRVAAGSITRIAIPDAAGTAAVALNLTTTSPRTSGFLTAFPCDSATPVVSNHNHVRDQVVASAAIVPVSSTGEVCVYSFADTNLIVDITGRLPAGTGVVPAGPERLADTRNAGPGALQPAGVPLRVTVPSVPGVSATAAVALDVTAVGASTPGFASVYPCDEEVPETSTVNYGAGAATPNLTIVRPGPSGDVCVVTSSDVNLLVDLFAVFDDSAELTLAEPVRVVDTRRDGGTPVTQGSTTVIDVAAAGVPADAGGVLANITATQAATDGFLTMFPCLAGLPVASNLNVMAGRDVANFVLVEPDPAGQICVYSSTATHVLVDVVGSMGNTFAGQTPQRLLDTRAT